MRVDDTVMARPLFSERGHQAWGADCPHCGKYWESLDTEKEHAIACDRCEWAFNLIYPGEKSGHYIPGTADAVRDMIRELTRPGDKDHE